MCVLEKFYFLIGSYINLLLEVKDFYWDKISYDIFMGIRVLVIFNLICVCNGLKDIRVFD